MPVINPNYGLCQIGTEYIVSGIVNNEPGTDEHQFSFSVSLPNILDPATTVVAVFVDDVAVPVPFDGAMKAMADAFYEYLISTLPSGYALEGNLLQVGKEIIGDVASNPAWTYTHP